MSNDIFKTVKFHPGQEVRAQDSIDAQEFLVAKLYDAIVEGLVPGLTTDDGPTTNFKGEFPYSFGSSSLDMIALATDKYAYALNPGTARPSQGSSNLRVRISRGVLMQKVAATDGDEQTLLSYYFDGTNELAIGNGDATDPRVDIIQMKLELEDGDAQDRVFSELGDAAALDLGLVTANVDTIVQCRARGFGGNQINVTLSPGGALQITEDGFDVEINYVDGVTTVADLENLIETDPGSTLLEVQSAGTGANVLVDPADSIADVFLNSGTNDVLVNQSFDMKRRVKCTLSVKQGTPDATPTYPDPDAGYVIVAGVLVMANYVGAAGFHFDDSNAASPWTAGAVLHDCRIPLKVRAHHVVAKNFYYDNTWTEQSKSQYIQAGGGATSMYALCPIGGNVGRVLGVQLGNEDGAGATIKLARYNYSSSGINLYKMHDCASLLAGASFQRLTNQRGTLEANHEPFAGPTIFQNNDGIGPPVWTGGRRCPLYDPNEYQNFDGVALLIQSAPSGMKVYHCTFWIAEGL